MSKKKSGGKCKCECKACRKILKGVKKIATLLVALILILFAVYFWNLDQKLMEWAYRRVNQIFDRKKTDIRF